MTLGHITRLMSETLNLIDDMTTDEIKDAIISIKIGRFDSATDASWTVLDEVLENRLSPQDYIDWVCKLNKFIGSTD